MTDLQSLDDFRTAFPVGQSTHTGKYGWSRVNGCLNLGACRFDTRHEAEVDRDSHWPSYQRSPDDFSR